MTKDFLETVIEDQKILDIGLKQSKQNKKERLDKEKSKRFPTAEERWPRRGIVIEEKEKTLHELLMEGFREEQRQRELEEEDDD